MRALPGEVPEWSNGLDSKSSDGLVPSVGSNPTLSARQEKAPSRGLFLSRERAWTNPPGFESHPLRQTRKGPLAGPFFVSRACVDEPTGVRSERGRAARQTAAGRPQGELALRANLSHPLRQTRKGPLAGPFFVSRACVDEPTGVRSERGRAGRQSATQRGAAPNHAPDPASCSITLSRYESGHS
jgi:hypothetical protein